jgi:hypothetical protein
MMNIQGDRKTKLRRQVLLNIYPLIASTRRLVNAAMVLLVQDIGLGGMLDQPVDALAELRILLRQEIGASILIGKDPTVPTIVCTHTPDSRDPHPHARSIGRIRNNRMQAESPGTRFPAVTGRVSGQPLIERPCFPVIMALPETGRVNTSVHHPRFAGPTRLDDPDVDQFVLPACRELNALSRFLPGLPKVIAKTYKRAEEVAILGGKQTVSLSLVKDGIEDATPGETTWLDGPSFPVLRG